MTIARRGFLRLLSATPLAGKMAVEQAAGRLAGVDLSGIRFGATPTSGEGPASANPYPNAEAIRKATLIPGNRKAIMDFLWEDSREVGYIDPDLAVLRSFSLNAKIAFQRQRNVERRFQSLTKDYPWNRMWTLIRKITDS
jgi:hypothetical protein